MLLRILTPLLILRVRMDRGVESQTLQPGADRGVEVAVQFGFPSLLLRGGGDGDQVGEQGPETGAG